MDFGELGRHLITTGAFTVLGLVAFAIAFWLWEVITPFSVQEELADKQNVAVAIVTGSILIGIAIIVVGALVG